MNINAKKKECRLVVKVKIPSGKKVDAKELDRFSRMYLRGFMKVKLEKKNTLEYSGPEAISLQKRLAKPISGRDLLFILEHVVLIAQKIRANNLGFHYLIMNMQNVYINEVTKEVHFIYFPVEGYTATTSLVAMIKNIVASAKPETVEDAAIVRGVAKFLKEMQAFSVERLEAYIASVDRSVIDALKKQNAGQSGFMTNKPQHYYEYYENKQAEGDDEATCVLEDEVDDEATGVLSDDVLDEADDEATGLLNENQEVTTLITEVPPLPEEIVSAPEEEPEEETTFLVMDEEEGTTLLSPEELPVEAPIYPTLYRTSTREDISVNKPVFRLGKEKSYVDYFVTNNPAVSRSHADIITRNNRYFIKDLNSKNRTYINSRPIEVQTEVELYDGDRIRLGNEEFIFHK